MTGTPPHLDLHFRMFQTLEESWEKRSPKRKEKKRKVFKLPPFRVKSGSGDARRAEIKQTRLVCVTFGSDDRVGSRSAAFPGRVCNPRLSGCCASVRGRNWGGKRLVRQSNHEANLLRKRDAAFGLTVAGSSQPVVRGHNIKIRLMT